MSPSAWKALGIGLSVLCFVLLFTAWERYQANAASVAAMNQFVQATPFGQDSPFGLPGQKPLIGTITPGIPPVTTYAMLFAFLSAVGAVVCLVRAGRRTLAPYSDAGKHREND